MICYFLKDVKREIEEQVSWGFGCPTAAEGKQFSDTAEACHFCAWSRWKLEKLTKVSAGHEEAG